MPYGSSSTYRFKQHPSSHYTTRKSWRACFLKRVTKPILIFYRNNVNVSTFHFHSYCLLPNQVHLIVEPKESELLSRAIGETHRRYTNYINERENWRGHLFQDRFFSYATDEQYGLRAARFVETLPVTIGIAPKPENYLWSSAKSRIKVVQNKLLKTFHSFHATQNWEDFLSRPIDPKEMNLIQLHLQTGRPRGSELFLDSIEKQIGRTVRPQKRGRKPYKKAINKKIA
ncbi:MAG: transposase [Alphaproteobacteria bacterium]